MSIVEKALGKLREQDAGTTVTTRSAIGAAARRGFGNPAAPAAALPRLPRSRSIRLDREALRLQGLLAGSDDSHRTVEEFRRIKWPLVATIGAGIAAEGATGASGQNLLMVTSALPGEGKTFSSFNLALVIAKERDSTVLLVDCDLAKPRLSHVLGLEAAPGMTDLLSNEALDPHGLIVTTDVDGLEVLPAGKPTHASPELVASRRMAQVLGALSTEVPNRIVLFDTPPLLSTNEAHVLAPQLAHVLMVVRADFTPRAAVNEALGLMEGHKSISLVLNQAAHGWMGERYGYGKYGYASQQEESGRSGTP